MRSLLVLAVVFSGTVEAFIGGGFGGGMPGAVKAMCCCKCVMPAPMRPPMPIARPMLMPRPVPVPAPIPVPVPVPLPCPCPVPVPMMGPQVQQPCCCTLVSPVQVVTSTAAPVGVPDIIKGSCGEIIVPLFNPPLPNQPNGK
ncbi:hypothetical protein GCK32_007711 [Trichostrongylus colubriformis]|uniref:Uncharacterized protein n=1 Tax=Trichostrongylus colubriformis TaxID=6319 RepID=A0AAN8ITF4_TRICO